MSSNEVTEYGAMFSGANHICIVTADLDRAVRRWWDRYRVGPWRVFSFDRSNMQADVNGSPVDFKMRAALAQLGPAFRLEIIQPLDELSPYAETLNGADGADHVHHVRLDVPDYARTRGELVALGLTRSLEASFKGSSSEGWVQATYFDTRYDLGLLLEIGNAPAGFTMSEPDYIYPE